MIKLPRRLEGIQADGIEDTPRIEIVPLASAPFGAIFATHAQPFKAIFDAVERKDWT